MLIPVLYVLSAAIILIFHDPFVTLILYSLCFGTAFRRLSGGIRSVFRLKPSPLSYAYVAATAMFIAIVLTYAAAKEGDTVAAAFCIYVLLVSNNATLSVNDYEPALFSLCVILSLLFATVAVVLSNRIDEGVRCGFYVFMLFSACRLITERYKIEKIRTKCK